MIDAFSITSYNDPRRGGQQQIHMSQQIPNILCLPSLIPLYIYQVQREGFEQ
jgi:hypothetical protein